MVAVDFVEEKFGSGMIGGLFAKCAIDDKRPSIETFINNK